MSSTEVVDPFLSMSSNSPAETLRKSMRDSMWFDRSARARTGCWSERDSSEPANELTAGRRGSVQRAVLARSADEKRIVELRRKCQGESEKFEFASFRLR